MKKFVVEDGEIEAQKPLNLDGLPLKGIERIEDPEDLEDMEGDIAIRESDSRLYIQTTNGHILTTRLNKIR